MLATDFVVLVVPIIVSVFGFSLTYWKPPLSVIYRRLELEVLLLSLPSRFAVLGGGKETYWILGDAALIFLEESVSIWLLAVDFAILKVTIVCRWQRQIIWIQWSMYCSVGTHPISIRVYPICTTWKAWVTSSVDCPEYGSAGWRIIRVGSLKMYG